MKPNSAQKQFYSLIEGDLKLVESMLSADIPMQSATLPKASKYITSNKGKLFRPSLAVLIVKNLTTINNRHLNLAAALELLHIASLVHDDVIDESPKRRGKDTLNSLYSNKTAILVGDYLFSRSSYRISQVADHTVTAIIADVLANLCDGEIFQSDKLFEKMSWEEYEMKNYKKTAVLIEAATWCGALISSNSQEAISAAKEYGKYLGLAFQVFDDILDYTSDTATLGKEAGADLLTGNITAPVLYAIEEKSALYDRIRTHDIDELRQVIIEVKSNKVNIDKSVALGNKYIEMARDNLNKLPDNQYRKALNAILDYTRDRNN